MAIMFIFYQNAFPNLKGDMEKRKIAKRVWTTDDLNAIGSIFKVICLSLIFSTIYTTFILKHTPYKKIK